MKMFFVVGSSRSGTTMTGRILNNHKDIFTFNELHFFEQLTDSGNLESKIEVADAARIYARLTDIQNEGFFNANPEQYLEESTGIVAAMPEATRTSGGVYKLFVANTLKQHNKKYGCDQTPRNALYVDDIFKTISEARIIFMVRDPRAVLYSQKNRWKRRKYSANQRPLRETIRTFCNYHPYTISRLWVAAMKQAKRWEKDERVILLKYEDLVQSPEQTLARICSFLGVEYDGQMLNIPYVGSSNKADEHNKSGISLQSKDAWKNGKLTKAEMYICEKVTRQFMDSFGYKTEAISKPYLGMFAQALIFPVKMTISLMLNLNRVKNLRQAILKRL